MPDPNSNVSKGECQDPVLLKTYIGCKIIRAEPMDSRRFLEVEKGKDASGMESRPGYKVIYPDGYVSWSPKDVFEGAYREVTGPEKILILK